MKKYSFIVASLLLVSTQNALAQKAPAQNNTEKLNIVSSIAPIHALLVELTKGAQKPRLLLAAKSMPHGARLTPSQARLLNQAQLLVLVGSNFASFEKSIKQTKKRQIVRLVRLQGLKRIRYGKKSQHSQLKHEKHAGEKHRSDDATIDPHLWLNPQNARVIVAHLAKVLGYLDKANRAIYLQNAKRIDVNIQKLDREIAESMSGLNGKFLVLHDATAYFVERYKINGQENLYGAGHNATRDGMRHSLTVRKKLREGKYRCVFVQAQAPQEVRDRLLAVRRQGVENQGADTKIIEINPLSATDGDDSNTSQQSRDHYADLLRAIAQGFHDCLA